MNAASRTHRPRMDQPAPGFPRDPRAAAARKGAWRDAVLADRQYSSTTKNVLVAILDFMAGDTGWAWPSEPTLAARVGKSERTIRGSVASLKAGGAVLVRSGGGRRRGKEDGRTNLYTIDWVRTYEETRQELAAISRTSAPDRGCRQLPVGIQATPGPKYRQEPAAYIPSENPMDPAHRARERATGDDDGAVAAAPVAAARWVDQAVDQQVVPRPEPPPPSELDWWRRHHAERVARHGAWGWWNSDGPDRVTRPPAAAHAEFAAAVHAYQRGCAGWQVDTLAGVRIVIAPGVVSRPTSAEVTAYAEAWTAGDPDAIALADHFRLLADVEAEALARHADAYRELVASGQEATDALDDLAAVDPERRLAAETKAAALAASWTRRRAGTPLAEPVPIAEPGSSCAAA